jgi:hypothetical protein
MRVRLLLSVVDLYAGMKLNEFDHTSYALWFEEYEPHTMVSDLCLCIKYSI